MSAPDPLDQHFDAYGRELRRAARSPRRLPLPGGRRPRLLLPALGAGGLTALAAGIVAAVVLPVGGGRIDVVQEARAALSAPDEILHYSVTLNSSGRFGPMTKASRHRCASEPSEVWRTTSGPLRWRMLMPLPPCAVRMGDGHITTGDVETSYADRVLSENAIDDGWMTVRTETRPVDAEIPWRLDGPVGQALTAGEAATDPVARLRGMLVTGELTDGGTKRDVDGTLLRRLVNHHRASSAKGAPWRPVTVEYFVNAETFAPVVIRSTRDEALGLDRAGRATSRTRYRKLVLIQRFDIFERIPITPATEKLLTVTPRPGTDVETISTPDWLRKLKAQNKSRRLPNPTAAESRRANKAIKKQIAEGRRPPNQFR